jgi:hypothetical protein
MKTKPANKTTTIAIFCSIIMATLLGAVAITPYASAATLCADTFTTGATPRAVNDPLIGAPAEVGGVSWAGAESLLKFTGSNTVTSISNSTAGAAYVSLATAPGDTVSVQADIKNVGTYASVLFNSAAGNVYDYSLDLRLYDNGIKSWGLYGPGEAYLSSGLTGSDVATSFIATKLTYNTTTHIAEVWLNGTLRDSLDVGVKSVAFAGIGGYADAVGNPGVSTFDNFSVGVVPVPEPASMMLLGTCLANLLAYGGRKRK